MAALDFEGTSWLSYDAQLRYLVVTMQLQTLSRSVRPYGPITLVGPHYARAIGGLYR